MRTGNNLLVAEHIFSGKRLSFYHEQKQIRVWSLVVSVGEGVAVCRAERGNYEIRDPVVALR